MDAFELKAEKGSAMPGHTLFAGIAKTLRILELCLALLLLSWILTRLPLALRLSADCLRSPLFVFALSNAIIAALLAQSARLTAADRGSSPSESDPSSAEEAEHRRKRVTDQAEADTCTDKDSCAVTNSDSRRVFYRRSWSEKLEGEGEDGRGKLRRSETEKARESLYPHDKLSNEEFRLTIEAFIAKQMRLLREESLAIIVQTSEQANNLSNC